jgi:hypothetical protein
LLTSVKLHNWLNKIISILVDDKLMEVVNIKDNKIDNFFVFPDAQLVHHHFLDHSTSVLVQWQNFYFLNHSFCDVLQMFVRKFVRSVSIQNFYHFLDHMISILIFNELNNRTVLQLWYQKILLVYLGKLKCFLNHSASIFRFRHLYHIP